MKMRHVILWTVFLDQVSKYLVVRYCHLGESVTILKDILYITYIQNPGAAFGFMATLRPSGRIPLFIVITLVAWLIVYSYQRLIAPEKRWQRSALGLIGGGALGNFIDRIFYGQVVDFIDAEHIDLHFSLNLGWIRLGPRFPWIFNVADSCITVGIVILICIYLFGVFSKKEGA